MSGGGSASAAALIGRAVEVEAPATVANLGAGYDCLGLAVELPLRVTVKAVESFAPGSGGSGGNGGEAGPIELTVEGDCVGELPADRSNRLVVALEAGLTALGYEDVGSVGWKVWMSNPIPLERGLGSSAAATVAGVVAASGLVGRPVDGPTALRIATSIEGHPDNVAPALYGGIVASIALEDRVEAVRIDPPRDVAVVAWIPERKLPTSEMRRVLPDAVPRADAIANLARVAVGVAGLATGRTQVLALLTEDRLHEPYRASVYPELPRLAAAARAAGALGAFLSGAGSTICALVDAADETAADRVGAALRKEAAALGQPGRLQALRLRAEGARLLRSL
ncbi:MAG TPA: homoserine kinase [Candidatus Binatia bacterium]|nr:homoserine kinase [Candidatus Binatia bacterium]